MNVSSKQTPNTYYVQQVLALVRNADSDETAQYYLDQYIITHRWMLINQGYTINENTLDELCSYVAKYLDTEVGAKYIAEAKKAVGLAGVSDFVTVLLRHIPEDKWNLIFKEN